MEGKMSFFGSKKRGQWDYVFLLLLALIVTVGLGALAIGSGAGRSDLPAWVQGIGTIVAIMVAIGVPGIQRRHEAIRAEEALMQGYRNSIVVLRYLVSELHIVIGSAPEPSFSQQISIPKALTDAEQRIKSFESWYFDEELAELVFETKLAIHRISWEFEKSNYMFSAEQRNLICRSLVELTNQIVRKEVSVLT